MPSEQPAVDDNPSKLKPVLFIRREISKYRTVVYYPGNVMAHVIQNKKKLLARISRIRGQINGIEKALNEERECGEVSLMQNNKRCGSALIMKMVYQSFTIIR